jgi:DNA-directed RNA polymerase subunit RPC12/RpoP
MVVQYKCPNCGADMAFDSTSGMLHCDSCGRNENIEDMAKYGDAQGKATSNTGSQSHTHSNSSGNSKVFDDEAVEYQCKNCGAVLITDKDTTATTCSFCGAGMVIGDRLTGSLAPAKVIPFSINKEQAQEAFKKWCKKGLLTPKGFMTADRIKSITGLYVPFWLYDLNGQGEVDATCTRVHTYSRGEYIYTDTSYYHVYRQVDLNYLKVPADASSKMNDELMDKLEPYHYDNLKEFNMPYLAGYIAEKYNYNDKELLPRIQDRIEDYVESYIRSTIQGYATTSYNHKSVNILQRHADYVLLPVWMVCYDYKQSEHIFAMNGQTGKIVGKPPLSKGKIAGWFAGVTGISFIIMQIVTLLAGGY